MATMPKEKRKMMIGLLKNGNIQFCQFQFYNFISIHTKQLVLVIDWFFVLFYYHIKAHSIVVK